MKNLMRSSAVFLIGVSLFGCHTAEEIDTMMDPLSAPESCVEGFRHSSAMQTLVITNTSSKPVSIVEFIAIEDGQPRLGTDQSRMITVGAGQTHKLYFLIDSFANGGSILYQTDASGKRDITLDPICVESFQAPIHIRQSEGDNAWLAVAQGDAPAKVLNLGLDDLWASDEAPSKEHTITIDEGTFSKQPNPDEIPESFHLKP